MDSRLFRFIVRALHLFPGVVLIVALGFGLFRACQFFQSADQFISVQSAVVGLTVNGGGSVRHALSLQGNPTGVPRESVSEGTSEGRVR